MNLPFKRLVMITMNLMLMFTIRTGITQPVSTIHPASTGIGDAIAVGPSGDIYGCSGVGVEEIVRITPAGERTVFKRGGGSPTGIAFDAKGNIWVVNYRQNNLVRISDSGQTTVIATGFNGPAHLVVSERDEVFVSEFGANFSGNGSRVIKIDADGSRSTYVSGNGLLDVIGLALDKEGNLYVGNWNSGRIYKCTGPQTFSLLADLPGRVNQIVFMNGYVYAPCSDGRIYRVHQDGRTTVLAGGSASSRVDGSLSGARFPQPNSIAFSPNGSVIYINDAPSGALRAISLIHDSDADGMSDANETVAGTNPTEAQSVFRILDFKRQPTGFQLRWASVPGRGYEVLSSVNLVDWLKIDEISSASANESEFLDTQTLNPDAICRHYTVRIK